MADYFTNVSFTFHWPPEMAQFLEHVHNGYNAMMDDMPDEVLEDDSRAEAWLTEEWGASSDEAHVILRISSGTGSAIGTQIQIGETSRHTGLAQVWIAHCPSVHDLDALGSMIQQVLLHFNADRCVGFEWSCTATHPRTDAYGGGACFITKDGIEWLSTGYWLDGKFMDWNDTRQEACNASA